MYIYKNTVALATDVPDHKKPRKTGTAKNAETITKMIYAYVHDGVSTAQHTWTIFSIKNLQMKG